MTAGASTGSTGAARALVFAPGGMPEVGADDDLAALVAAAVAADPDGPLRDGDVVVVTSKVVSKAEGRAVPAAERDQAVRSETVATVASRGPTRIVRTQHGLTLAAGGVDTSNVDPRQVLRLPVDPDDSAARLRRRLHEITGAAVGVVVSDTSGRPWRQGQTDVAVGAAGVVVLDDHRGRRDPYGNELQVTAVAVADELAAAADLVKTKLGGRPVAVVRGLAGLAAETTAVARDLLRPIHEDLFALGRREAVLHAVLAATGQAARFEELVGLGHAEATEAAVAGAGLSADAAAVLHRVLAAALPDPTAPGA